MRHDDATDDRTKAAGEQRSASASTRGAFQKDHGDYAGPDVHISARIGALAQGDEILVGRESLDGCSRFRAPSRAPRRKGFEGVRSSSSQSPGAETRGAYRSRSRGRASAGAVGAGVAPRSL